MLRDQAVNEMAHKTLQSAFNVIRVYASAARPKLIRAVTGALFAFSLWIVAMGLYAFAIHDAVIGIDDAHAIGRLVLWATVLFISAILSAQWSVRALMQSESTSSKQTDLIVTA